MRHRNLLLSVIPLVVLFAAMGCSEGKAETTPESAAATQSRVRPEPGRAAEDPSTLSGKEGWQGSERKAVSTSEMST